MQIKKLIFILLIPLFTLAALTASPVTSGTWLGVKTTSTYPMTFSLGSHLNTEHATLSVEQIGLEQTLIITDFNFKTNKTFRQELYFSHNFSINKWYSLNGAYLIGQDFSPSIFYLRYRVGLQFGFNHLLQFVDEQYTLSPVLYIDTGLDMSFLKIGLRFGSMTDTESSLQALPIIKPYLTLPIKGFGINFSTEIKLSDFLYDKVSPILSGAVRIGVSYTRGKE